MIQRLRVKFGRGEETKFISHLDIMRFWERALRRARIPLSYSKGFSPHPQISIAAPLAVGVTSEAELMDVGLKLWMPPQSFMMRVKNHLPRGFDIFDVWEVGLNMPSLQSSVTFAEYCVDVNSEEKVHDIENSLHSLLQLRELPWHHLRGEKEHFYDLRALIDNVWLIESQQPARQSKVESQESVSQTRDLRLRTQDLGLRTCYVLGMKLRCDDRGSGRPDQVTAALGLSEHPDSIHRTKILIDNSRR
ncbi:MAG: TIGR03936 family radical SAM-associated protein [Chloroflexota bacterium]|nr:TIGR03936 family radical SAM-associated protein [Chloroflexota bacterium]